MAFTLGRGLFFHHHGVHLRGKWFIHSSLMNRKMFAAYMRACGGVYVVTVAGIPDFGVVKCLIFVFFVVIPFEFFFLLNATVFSKVLLPYGSAAQSCAMEDREYAGFHSIQSLHLLITPVGSLLACSHPSTVHVLPPLP